MRLLIFNAGSSSLKFDLTEVAGAAVRHLRSGTFLDKADGSGELLLKAAAPAPPMTAPLRTLAEAADFLLGWLAAEPGNLLAGLSASVHRIVHGGETFRAPTRLGERELAALAQLNELAPLHNPPALAVIARVRARLGSHTPLVGVFDTAWYADLPESAYRYAVPQRWQQLFGVRRYGFHGIAHRYLCSTAAERLAPARSARRIISLQLGRGCSVSASLEQRPVATSMGFTPLEGLVMGTRCGDLDPGALLYVLERSGMSAPDMSRELNCASGLLGLSGRTADMRELLELEARGEAPAALAVEIFCRRARHYVGAYLAELGGADLIVFGGGIGENSPAVRARILRGQEWAGIAVDPAANGACVARDGSIAAPASRVALEVLQVDEASVLAREAAALLAEGGAP
jgi:acetate kinase